MNLLLLVLFFSSYICLAESEQTQKRKLKILVYSPTLSFSHAQFMGKIADTLQGAGHEVHFFKFVADRSLHEKNETKLVENIYVVEPKTINANEMDIAKQGMIRDSFAGAWPTMNFFNHPFKDFVPFSLDICKDVIGKTELLDRLAKEQFDVGLAEMYDLCPMAVLHRIGVRSKMAVFAVPLLQMVGRRFGIPVFPSYVPNMVVPSTEPLASSFYARFFNFYNELYDWSWMDDASVRAQDPVIQRQFGPTFPSLKEIVRNISLVFVNSNPFFESPRPISSKVIYIGGLVDKNGHSEQNLDERSKHILDNAIGGAVLLSFGSIADTRAMGRNMRTAILRAFSRFPAVQFLWKLDTLSRDNDSALFASAPNVHIFEWIRQSAVLKHPNMRAFITHCGQNSLTEASRAGVPVVGIPLFGDQLENLVVAKHTGMGLHIDVRHLNGPDGEEVLVEALKRILYEPKYRQRAQLIKKKLALMPFSPAEMLVRWVEFAAEFPNLNELNLPSDEEMGWFVYYSLDVITFTLAILFALLWLAWKCAKLTFSMAAISLENSKTTQKLKRQ